MDRIVLSKQEIIQLFAKNKDNEETLRRAIRGIVGEIDIKGLEQIRDFILYELEILV